MTDRIANFVLFRNKAKAMAAKQKNPLDYSRRFLAAILSSYFPETKPSPVAPLDDPLAVEMGRLAASLDYQMAGYLIGTTYAVMLPDDYRSKHGVFYTPPALVERLLNLAEQAGVDWSTARVVDPACGGGAFLAPVAMCMKAALSHLTPAKRLAHIEEHLLGLEIDPFSAWISQIFVEIALQDDLIAANNRCLGSLVKIGDSLQTKESLYSRFDLVIGNPPYGKVKLNPEDRKKWKRSLYGHANLYGLFTDLATRLVRPGGRIAYVTPTSFLGGQYFKALRSVLVRETPPLAIDLIEHREGVFADVLQEALLAVYKKQTEKTLIQVSYLSVMETGKLEVKENGSYTLPSNPEEPWILPRNPAQSELAYLSRQSPYRLSDLGYTVSTGPLVWNRHKERLFALKDNGAIPLIWAECVDPEGSGAFTFKATGRNHVLWYKPQGPRDPNVVKNACVLLQRTTALEQKRRLIAAELNQDFIERHGGAVSIENHLNMIRPIPGKTPKASLKVIARLLNSEIVDQIFRCINGSVAVSAYELESMPLPSPTECERLEKLLAQGASKKTIEMAIKEMYFNVCKSTSSRDSGYSKATCHNISRGDIRPKICNP